jgi:hypothetical protein
VSNSTFAKLTMPVGASRSQVREVSIAKVSAANDHKYSIVRLFISSPHAFLINMCTNITPLGSPAQSPSRLHFVPVHVHEARALRKHSPHSSNFKRHDSVMSAHSACHQLHLHDSRLMSFIYPSSLR